MSQGPELPSAHRGEEVWEEVERQGFLPAAEGEEETAESKA